MPLGRGGGKHCALVAAYIEKDVGLVKRRLPQLANGTAAWWLEVRPFFGGLGIRSLVVAVEGGDVMLPEFPFYQKASVTAPRAIAVMGQDDASKPSVKRKWTKSRRSVLRRD
jgi:hypothetical protein